MADVISPVRRELGTIFHDRHILVVLKTRYIIQKKQENASFVGKTPDQGIFLLDRVGGSGYNMVHIGLVQICIAMLR